MTIAAGTVERPRRPAGDDTRQMIVVQNWIAEFAKKR